MWGTFRARVTVIEALALATLLAAGCDGAGAGDENAVVGLTAWLSADADRAQLSTVDIELGQPEADGDLLTVAARTESSVAGFAAARALRTGAIAYRC